MSIFKKENGALVEYTNPLPANYVAPIEDGATSAHNYAVGAFALVKGVLRKITTAVTRGTAITNANSKITTVAEQLEEINSELYEETIFEHTFSISATNWYTTSFPTGWSASNCMIVSTAIQGTSPTFSANDWYADIGGQGFTSGFLNGNIGVYASNPPSWASTLKVRFLLRKIS